MGRLFGTDGVRGVANSEITVDLAFDIGRAVTSVLTRNNKRPVVVIGKDTRVSGDMLENALTAGVLTVGGNVIKLGIIPTPAVAYLVNHYEADAGVVISASHNSYEYNGIKIFNGDGYKLDDRIEEEIEGIILRRECVSNHIIGDALGKCLEGNDDAIDLYVRYLLTTVDLDLKGKKIVLDTANGASYRVAEKVFKALNADITIIANEPNGININHNCGSTHTEKLQEAVVKTGASIGLAFDGDADRLIVVDEKGLVVDGDKVICICAKLIKEQGNLKDNKVTVSVMSNLGLHKFMQEHGISVDVTGVGDRYILESMIKTGCVLGGEQSGHIIFKNYSTTGDGIMSSLQLLKAIEGEEKTLNGLSEEIVIYPQVLVNAEVPNKKKKTFSDDAEVAAEIKRIEELMHGNGRVLIRPSGTEPLVRVMIEGKDISEIHELAQGLSDLITEKFKD
ncbi:MAG: phosphoglucosamine mutase [Clostridiales bacterium]|nr:phosphoglucosamine mutase [Clostridiales bacterium]